MAENLNEEEFDFEEEEASEEIGSGFKGEFEDDDVPARPKLTPVKSIDIDTTAATTQAQSTPQKQVPTEPSTPRRRSSNYAVIGLTVVCLLMGAFIVFESNLLPSRNSSEIVSNQKITAEQEPVTNIESVIAAAVEPVVIHQAAEIQLPVAMQRQVSTAQVIGASTYNNNFQNESGNGFAQVEQTMDAPSESMTQSIYDDSQRRQFESDQQASQLLQLEAEVAMLKLELTKQRTESYAAMRVAGESATAVLDIRNFIKGMGSEISAMKKDVAKGTESVKDLAKQVEQLKSGDLAATKTVVAKSAAPPKESAVSVATKVVAAEPIVPIEDEVRRLALFEPVMVTEYGGYVTNIANGKSKVLEINAKYADVGRVTHVDQTTSSIYGISPNGEEWVISPSDQLL